MPSAAGVLGRLGALAREIGIDQGLPVPVRYHMQAKLTLAEQQQRAVRWELVQLSRTLAGLDGPVLLLKGAAYAAAGLPPAAGRLFSDIDLLVPKAQVDAAEAALMLDGWNSSQHDAYDQRYYRQWMHELPPMMHIRRKTVLDLHHNILPETARIRVDPAPMLAAARTLAAFPRFSIPAPEDLVLHSATHLFHEGEWEHGLRDLVDLDAMLRTYARDPAFGGQLSRRAESIGLGWLLHDGLRHARRWLATPLPQDLIDNCPGRPGVLHSAAMDRLFDAAFATAHASCRTPLSGTAAWMLYVRSHWLRMSPHLLMPHLVREVLAAPAGQDVGAARASPCGRYLTLS